jgi:hypothetical protein
MLDRSHGVVDVGVINPADYLKALAIHDVIMAIDVNVIPNLNIVMIAIVEAQRR